jgi:hypothetical protein
MPALTDVRGGIFASRAIKASDATTRLAHAEVAVCEQITHPAPVSIDAFASTQLI